MSEFGRTESRGNAGLGKNEALFIAWLKRNGGGKRLTVCLEKLRQLDLSEGTLLSFPPGGLRVQRQRGERFVLLEDRGWADELAKANDVKVLHHAQYFKLKDDLL